MVAGSRYAAVAARAGHRCEYCRAPEALFNAPFEVEHIVPRSLGGRDTLDNLALACRSCNVHKSAAVGARDPRTGRLVTLFNPRVDEWNNHFRLRTTTGRIVGRTATGRATVRRLAINSPHQLRARLLWLALSWLP